MASQFEDQIRNRLRSVGVRYTAGRKGVVDTLAACGGPRSASELYVDMAGSHPISSLYRSLTVLADAGVLAPHHGSKGVTRYELAEWLQGHHHHLVCSSCGSVDDIELTPDHESAIEAVVAHAADQAGFRMAGHALEIDGHCAECA